MASISATCSPSSPGSLQLRLAFNASNCRKFPIVLNARIGNLDRRVRLLCVAEHGNGAGGVHSGGSRVGSDPNVDGLPGWSNSDGGERSTSSQQQQKEEESYGGVVGVGVAGVILLSGLTFAALSINKRISSRQVQHMNPLTAQQELLLSSDNHSDEIFEHVNAGNKVDQGNGNIEGQIDISRDCLSPESDEIPNHHRIVDDSVHAVNNTPNYAASTNHMSIQEELQHESVIDDKLAVSSEGTMAVNFPESENDINSLNTYGFKDFDSSTAVDTANSVTDLEENPFDVEARNMSDYDAELLHLITDHQDEIIDSSSSIRSDVPNTSSFVDDNEHLLVKTAVSPQSNNTTSNPEVFPDDGIENALSASTKENLDPNKMSQVPAEGNNSSLEEQCFSGNDLFRKSDVTSADTLIDELDRNDNKEVNKSRSESPDSGGFLSAPGIPAPSVASTAVQMLPGKVLVPAAVDQVQGQALAALQALKVIERDVQPSDLCTRREYARWLVSASSALSRNTISKIYPAMYIDNVSELAFDDVTPEDPDFSSIQGLAEAGLIKSRLSRRDAQLSADEDNSPLYFFPDSPLSRQDLLSWKMALEKRQLPEANRKMLHQLYGFIDTDKIHLDACPALVADISAGEHGIIALAFGYTRLFQPHKPVTKAQAAVALATGDASDVVSEELARIDAESMAENVVASHRALLAQLEKDINAGFEQELFIEKEKIKAVERMAEEARFDLERLRAEREEDKIALMRERAAVESEKDVFSRLRHEVEDQLQNLMNNKVEIAYEKERISKLREQSEVEKKEIARLQYELEVERKALSIARAWAEDEAKRVSEHAKALERARDNWEMNGIKVVVDDDLHEEASPGVTLLNAEEQFSVEGTLDRAENLLDKLKKMAADMRGKSRDTIDKIIHMVSLLISRLKEWAHRAGKHAEELREAAISKVGKSALKVQQSTLEFISAIKDGAKRVAEDCREGVQRLAQKFKT